MTPQMITGRHIMVGVIILAMIRIEAMSIIIIAVVVIIVELTWISDFVLFVHW